MSIKSLTSCDEFERVCLAGEIKSSCELIDGEIVLIEPSAFEQGFSANRIGMILGQFVHSKKLGWVLGNEIGLHIKSSMPRTRGADCAYISFKRLPRNKRPHGFLRVAPELIVEVFGETNTWEELDEEIKDYHQTGVDVVWVADPHTRTVKVFPKKGEPSVVHDGEAIDGGSTLPGFKVSIAKFFDPE